MDFVGGVPPGPTPDRSASWLIARLIELLDAAIDSAGEQLARSEGLRFEWTDGEAGSRQARPVRRPLARRENTVAHLEDDLGLPRGIETP